MTRSRKILALVGALLVLALAGCVRFQADLSVDEQNLLDGDIVVAVITNPDEPDSEAGAKEAAAGIEAQLLPTLRGADGVTAEPYTEDDYVGTRFTLNDTPMEALDGGDADGALQLTRVGDEFEFSGLLDFTPDDEQLPEDVDGDAGDGGITVAISFPGEVTSHNGELNGTKVTWSTSLEGSVEMHATASAIPATPSGPVVIAIIVGSLVALLLVVLLVLLLLRRRRANAAQ